MKLLFLCTDNFTRSVTAELCAKHYISKNNMDNMEVDSAGFRAESDLSIYSDIHFDRMKELGVDTSSYKRTAFKEEYIPQYDFLIGMGKEHKDYILSTYGRKIHTFNEIYENRDTSIVIPPPDQDGKYLNEIKNMVDYIYDAIPVLITNLLNKEEVLHE
ncbi:hypothetical protein ACFO3D_13780 [Virgibacillus kekensis]|uniref:Phosphotyrosine protein phosphatase I domain-containing protein n=1 Tax=Virgibacillus kekensis TaxID=202261 RepID=A0ABV9DN59_9BACI